jgi:hypothetical protein
MKKNVGAADKVIRIIIAALLVILYFANVVHGTLGIILLIVALVLLITAFTGFCGLYVLFGISTCKKEKKK